MSGPSDTTAADAADASDDVEAEPTPFACGGLECRADQACASTWQGACIGRPPGPDGCGPDCAPTQCGGGEVCLCAWFECVDLGACTTCECIVALRGRGSCLCEDAGDHFLLSCPAA